MKKCAIAGLFLAAVLLVLPACKKKAVPPQAQEEASAPQILPGTTIYLDTSMSIRGYFRVSPNTGSTLQRLLWDDLLGILAEDNQTPAYIALFGSKVAPPKFANSLRPWTFFRKDSDLLKIFSQVETNLIGVFEHEDFSKRSISIVITDGIQSAVEGEGSKNIVGFDRRIFNVIRNIGQAGSHLWLIAVNSEFNGPVYPERPSADGERHPYYHAGTRSVYLWIASRDARVGRDVTEKIIDKLRSLANNAPSAVKAACLTTLPLPVVDLKIDYEASTTPILSKETGPGQFEWLIARTNSERVEIPIQVEEKSVQKLDIHWELRMELGDGNVQWAELLRRDDEWVISLSYRDIPGGEKGRLQISALASPVKEANPWWKVWSTEDDSLRENAAKTLYLERLNPIIEEVLGKTYPVAQVVLKIRKP